MRKEDTVAFLSHFLDVRAAPLIDSFRDWANANYPAANAVIAGADHFSYKCREVREYDELRGRFEEYADGWRGCRFLHQAIVSGRRVAVIGLTDPVITPLGDLKYLELSEPKPMSADAGGFDHVEIYPRLHGKPRWAAFADLAARLNERSTASFMKKDRPHHPTWDAWIPTDGQPGRQGFILRLTDEPLVMKLGREML